MLLDPVLHARCATISTHKSLQAQQHCKHGDSLVGKETQSSGTLTGGRMSGPSGGKGYVVGTGAGGCRNPGTLQYFIGTMCVD